jgi:hypothetical protein
MKTQPTAGVKAVETHGVMTVELSYSTEEKTWVLTASNATDSTLGWKTTGNEDLMRAQYAAATQAALHESRAQIGVKAPAHSDPTIAALMTMLQNAGRETDETVASLIERGYGLSEAPEAAMQILRSATDRAAALSQAYSTLKRCG